MLQKYNLSKKMKTALRVINLNKQYRNKVQALKNFNLSVKENSFLALLGKNGAGKTTFIGIISSLVKKTSGKILACGKDIDRHTNKIKTFIGIVPQELNLPIFEKPIQVLINQAGYFGIPPKLSRERAYKYLTMLDLWNKHDSAILTLSGGMKRRLMLARALMHKPSVLFLDEPTVGVDIEIRYKIWNFLKELHNTGKTIFLTTHYLEEAEKLCDSLAIIDKGTILLHEKMSKILATAKNTLVLDIGNKDLDKSAITSKNNNIKFIDNYTIEINVTSNQKGINTILSKLISSGIIIRNIRHQQNSLENFFNNIITK